MCFEQWTGRTYFHIYLYEKGILEFRMNGHGSKGQGQEEGSTNRKETIEH